MQCYNTLQHKTGILPLGVLSGSSTHVPKRPVVFRYLILYLIAMSIGSETRGEFEGDSQYSTVPWIPDVEVGASREKRKGVRHALFSMGVVGDQGKVADAKRCCCRIGYALCRDEQNAWVDRSKGIVMEDRQEVPCI